MDSPVRKMQKEKDYQRHKLFRKMKRRRKAKAEQEQKIAEKALKKKLGLPRYDGGKTSRYNSQIDDIEQPGYRKYLKKLAKARRKANIKIIENV